MRELKWTWHSGGSVKLFPPSRTKYEVRWRGGTKTFDGGAKAERFYNDITPEQAGESKALWVIYAGVFPELAESEVAEYTEAPNE